MSNKTFCDRCGEEADYRRSVTLRNFDWDGHDVEMTPIYTSPERRKDLCSVCFNKVVDFINQSTQEK